MTKSTWAEEEAREEEISKKRKQDMENYVAQVGHRIDNLMKDRDFWKAKGGEMIEINKLSYRIAFDRLDGLYGGWAPLQGEEIREQLYAQMMGWA